MDTPNNNASGQEHNSPEVAPVTKVETNVLMATLAYLGPLVIVSYLVAKDDSFVKFHIKQGLVLLAIWLILWILMGGMMFWSFWQLFMLVRLILLALSILGIVNAVQKKEKELPVIGSLAKYFKF